MKRERNRRSHAAMLRSESVQRLYGALVAEYNGNLPTSGAQLCLPLRACFRWVVELHAAYSFRNLIASSIRIHPLRGTMSYVDFPGRRTLRCTCSKPFSTWVAIRGSLLRLRQASVASRSWKRMGFWSCISFLQSGRIPAMCLSYSVTSDVSTGIYMKIENSFEGLA